jgi:flagellar assembly protein FliH
MARIIKSGSKDGSGSPGAAVRTLGEIAEEARTVILDARKEAARIAAEARAHADAARQVAARQGYQEGAARGQNDGYQDGHRRGLAEAKEQLAAQAEGLIEQARQIVEALSQVRAEVLHGARCEMLDFALLLAEKIVARVAAEDPAAARENLRKVLELSDSARQVRVKVNPGQLSLLEECLPRLVEALGRTGRVRLVGDDDVSPGGVRLFSASGEIDATVETQLANVVEALLGASGDDGRGRYEPQGASPVPAAPREDAPPKRALSLEDGSGHGAAEGEA